MCPLSSLSVITRITAVAMPVPVARRDGPFRSNLSDRPYLARSSCRRRPVVASSLTISHGSVPSIATMASRQCPPRASTSHGAHWSTTGARSSRSHTSVRRRPPCCLKPPGPWRSSPPPAFPPGRHWDGLDARGHWPPLLSPGVLFDLDAYSAFEQFIVDRLTHETTVHRALEIVAAAVERLREWNHRRGSFLAWANETFSETSPMAVILPDGCGARRAPLCCRLEG